MAQSDVRLTGDQEDQGFDPHRVQQQSFMETDHEIFSTNIFSLRLIQEGHFRGFVKEEYLVVILG